MNRRIKRWEVYLAFLGDWKNGKVVGHEIGGERPVIILSVKGFFPSILPVVPITGKKKEIYENDPHAIKISPNKNHNLDGYILIDHIRSISIKRLIKRVGVIKNKDIRLQIQVALQRYLGILQV